MQLNLFFYALAMLCGLASVAFATLDPTWRGQGMTAIGFAVGAVAARLSRLPDPVWLGSLVAFLAVVAILRPRTRTVVAACGGALAGLWASMLHLGGAPWPMALLIAAGALALSAFFTRRSAAFAPAVLQDEALVVVVLLGIMVAIAPGVVGGWQSAVVLNLQPNEVASGFVPAWTLLPTLGAAALGGLYTIWMRR